MAISAKHSKSILSDGYLVQKAETHPIVRRFLDTYHQLEECDRLAVEAKLTEIMMTIDKMGILGAVELLMYAIEYRAALECGRRRATKQVRLGHALEQQGWPEKKPALVEGD